MAGLPIVPQTKGVPETTFVEGDRPNSARWRVVSQLEAPFSLAKVIASLSEVGRLALVASAIDEKSSRFILAMVVFAKFWAAWISSKYISFLESMFVTMGLATRREALKSRS